MDENKNYPETKVYFDGSHYIGIPKDNYPRGKGSKRKKTAIPTPQQAELKAKFETAYRESRKLPKQEQKQYIAEQLQNEFATPEQATEYTEQNMRRKRNNAAKRYTILWRKIYTQGVWNFFITFTYSNELHTEETFKETLRNTLKHLVYRKGWKYIGVWERATKNQERLHFHGIFYIPENGMIGKIEQVSDYDTRKHRKQTTFQNTHFTERFGRNDFKEICKYEIKPSVKYLLKYIEKSGEKLVYGGKLQTYTKCNILGKDVVCPIGIDDKKIVLFDNFTCIDDDGVVRGTATQEVLAQMPKVN